ncbi:DUF5765 domain-containing protein [Candidatus Methylospira mobilis]|uniref:DUF5765 domain-containing protein n=1 Tax=Candidatus Methylospira mobilis TaxID=1808979 RepID=UPI0028EDDC28|nr:DUF5765 domain-containing protein [Candidatus Methylospira mobilis]WNV06242.1 DUF5765 domain-containing protein [Candidatus Methylospira mobilis]
MCWSGEASAVLAGAGFGTAAYVAWRGESKELWIPLTYFVCMELLQAATYVYINLCDAPPNQMLTLFGYLHIAFQPFFVNMVAMYFIPEAVKRKIGVYIYALCAVGAVAMLVKMYPMAWAGKCIIGFEGFCGEQACSVSGDWHIAWQLPLNGLMSDYPGNPVGFRYGLHGFAYIVTAFYLPLLYGSWRFVGFHYRVGPLISDVLTSNPNEYAAVWCLFSIALCVSVIKTPVRRYLHVNWWFGYRRLLNYAPSV